MDPIISFCKGLRELALFAGAEGGILGGKLLGWRTVCAVEIEPYCQAVLAQRQNEGLLEPFPIWDDVCSFRGSDWRGCIDIISGGFPCQDISAANGKAEGITGKKSGLWKQMLRIICEIRPKFVFVENSPFLATRGLAVVLGDLAASGYDAEWDVCGADTIGANHERKRMWILAGKVSDTDNSQYERSECSIRNEKKFTRTNSCCQTFPDPRRKESRKQTDTSCEGAFENWKRQFIFSTNDQRDNSDDTLETLGEVQESGLHHTERIERSCFKDWWETEPGICRVVDGMANRMDRLRAVGNGQVPAVAAFMFVTLLKRLIDNNG